MAIVIPPPFAQAQAVPSLLPPSVTGIGASALPGETIAIFGANFFNITSVDFNGTSAIFSVQDQGWISAVVPIGATTGPIHVVNKLGVATSATFTVLTPGRLVRAGWPIPTATGTTPEAGGRIYTMAMYLRSDATAFNFRIANRDYASGMGLGSFTANIAAYASDGTGKPTGSPFASYTGQTVPGEVGSASFLSLAFSGVTRGIDGKVVICIGVPQGTTIAYQGTLQQGYYSAGSTNVSTAPSGLSTNIATQFFCDISYQSVGRALVFMGDSITVGYNSVFETTAAQFIAAHKDWAIDAKGIVQIGSFANFAAYTSNPYFWDEQAWIGDPDVVWMLGTNDLSYSNFATMKAAMLTCIAHAASLTTGRQYMRLCPPQAAYADANGARLSWNADVRANYASYGITAIYDAAAAQSAGGLADNSTQTSLYSAYDSGDDTHINAAGNAQEQAGLEAIL